MKIFLSAVTGELGSYRKAITNVLHGVDYEVRVQEQFRPTAITLLEYIRNYIRECDLVILLVGERCGAYPTPNEVSALRRIAVFEEFRAVTKLTVASYTQWEFILAREMGKNCLVFFTSDGFSPDNPNPETADFRVAQQTYRKWIEGLGLVRTPLTTKEQLEKDVLRSFVAPEPTTPPPEPIHRPQNLPYHSLNELFKGRDEFIKTLRQSLARTSDRRATAIVQSRAVHGLGGVGKTRLAVEYAWQHATDYTALLFVGADSPENLRRNLAALVAPAVLNLPEHDLPHEDVRMAAAVRWLEQHPGWLLILDNVDTPEAAREVQKTLPQFRHGHVLITSRRSQWSATVEPLELDKLALADSADFLLERTAKQRRPTATDGADAESLARELDGLALALEQAGAYIAQRHCSIAEYLAQWRAHDRAVQEWFDDTVMNYPRSVATTWETTLEQLGPGEVALLRMFAWFAPDPIPLFVLDGEIAAKIWHETAALFAQEREAKSEVTGTPRDALVNLTNYGMAKWNGSEDVSIHRVVQEILRNRTPKPTRNEWITTALLLLDASAPAEPYDVRTWPWWSPLRPHIAMSVTVADGAGITELTARLMSDLASLLSAKALYHEAEPLIRRALIISEQSWGPQHPNVATCLNILASLLCDLDRPSEAEPLARRALAIDELNFGPDHPSIAKGLNNLVHSLHGTKHTFEIEPLMRRAVSIDLKALGPMHPQLAVDLNNLARLLQDTDRLTEAESLIRQALDIDEKHFGREHPSVARDLMSLAALLQTTEHRVEAEPLIRRALSIDERSYGTHHPHVAFDLGELARLLQKTNRFDEAEPMMRRALIILEQSFGPEHPNVLDQLFNLAQMLEDLNRPAEAEPMMRGALAIHEKRLGPADPVVAVHLSSVARLLHKMNRLSEAEPMLQRAIVIFVRRLGAEHSWSQGAARNYAKLLKAKGLSQEQATKAVAEVVAAASRGNG